MTHSFVGPGCDTANMCSTVAGLLAGLAGVPADAPVDAGELVGLRALAERAQALYLARLARFDSTGAAAADGAGASWAWLRDHGRALPAEARAEVWLARRLHTDAERAMPGTEAALGAGRLSVGQARLIAQGLSRLPAGRASEMEPTLAEQAAVLGPAATARICQHLIAIGEDEEAAGRAERERAARHLHLRPVGGMLHLHGLLPPGQAAPLQIALDAYSQPAPAEPDGTPDPRSAAQRRADALCEIGRRALDAGAPSVGGLRPHVQLLIHLDPDAAVNRAEETHTGPVRGADWERDSCDPDLSWTAVTTPRPDQPGAGEPGAVESGAERADTSRTGAGQPGGGQTGRRPGRAGQHQDPKQPWLTPDGLPLDPAIIAAIRAALPPALGGTGTQILAAGRTSRLIPPHIRRALNVRDQGCVHPGCDRPPERCHAHHRRHWAHGGPTDLTNLVLACPTHHQFWHDHDLKPHQQPDGSWQLHHDPHAAAHHHRRPGTAA